MAPTLANAPIGIYIHFPFCTHICPYCDFNTWSGQEDRIPAYLHAVGHELERRASGGRREAASIFFGGGTPSLMEPEAIARLVERCRSHYDLIPEAEITMESNPRDLTMDRCAGYLAAGVNRLSIGVQTLDRKGLRVLGRQHEATDALHAYSVAREAGFDNISLDLIFGWPGQTLDSWRRDLLTILDWPDGGPDHLSLYSLIVEPGTPMADALTRGILVPVDDDSVADLYEAAIAILNDASWSHYEIANWTRRPGQESQHNLIYWRNGEYLGIGAGAHGRTGTNRWMNLQLPSAYIDSIVAGDLALASEEHLSPETQQSETMMLGLRLLQEGVDRDAFLVRHGVTLESRFGAEISRFTDLGLLMWDGPRLRVTSQGTLIANEILVHFV